MIYLKIKNISVGVGDSYIVDVEVSADSAKVIYNIDKMFVELASFKTIDLDRLSFKDGVLSMKKIDYFEACRGILVLSSELDESVQIEVEKFLFEDDLYEVATKYFDFKRGGREDA